jgi:hypothetical protein
MPGATRRNIPEDTILQEIQGFLTSFILGLPLITPILSLGDWHVLTYTGNESYRSVYDEEP